MQDRQEKMIIYQMLPRLFGNKATTNKPFGAIEENGVGKFNDITAAALKGIGELGVTHVWYTGVLEHAVLTDYSAYGITPDDADIVKGRAGSPYSIKDYYDVDPDLAMEVPNRMKEFEALIARTHDEGLKVIIDFVPNHVARRYHSDAKPPGVKDFGEEDDPGAAFSPSNNFYYLVGESFVPPVNPALPDRNYPERDGKFEETPAKATANDKFTPAPALDDWFESAKLNYGVDFRDGSKHFDPIPDTWLKMRDILLFWTAQGVDGFRCDMAEMVPVEFWHWVIPQVKEVDAAVIFIAEIYTPSMYRDYLNTGGFDFLYDKVQLYDTLRRIMGQASGTDAIPPVQRELDDLSGRLLHFMENHDEQRVASPYFAGDGWKAVPAMTISATIDRGPVMIYFGQEVGEPGAGAEGFSTHDGRTTIFDYWGVPSHQQWMNGGRFDGGLLSDEQKQLRQFYADLLNLARTNPAVAQGEYFDLTEVNQEKGNFSTRIHAFARFFSEERLVIVSGFNAEKEDIAVTLPGELVTRMQLEADTQYIGRDLLRSGIDIGLDSTYTFRMEVMPFSAYIIKIK